MDSATFEKTLQRERKRRRAAEHLLEEKSRELYKSYQQLEQTHLELQQNKDQLVQSEKMASLGLMSAGVAHEINNPIGFIVSNVNTLGQYLQAFACLLEKTQSLLRSIDTDSPLSAQSKELASYIEEEEIDYLIQDSKDLIEETDSGLKRVIDIVGGLKTFARADGHVVAETDVNECLTDTIRLAETQLKHTCEIVVELTTIPMIDGNAGRLGQVFLNLIMNASQAVEEGSGRITVRSYLCKQRDGGLNREVVVVEIEDNGCGISEENQAKLFQPFFTTKDVGEGTGLGLSISLGIVEDHGGILSVTSRQDIGSVFRVELPLAVA